MSLTSFVNVIFVRLSSHVMLKGKTPILKSMSK